MESRSKYAGRYIVTPIPHVVVVGRLSACARGALPRSRGAARGTPAQHPRGKTMMHCVVATGAGAETVAEFFNEFNHAAHSSMERIVFMSPLPASTRLQTLLTSRHYVARCVFLQGTVFEDADLLRAGVPEVCVYARVCECACVCVCVRACE